MSVTMALTLMFVFATYATANTSSLPFAHHTQESRKRAGSVGALCIVTHDSSNIIVTNTKDIERIYIL